MSILYRAAAVTALFLSLTTAAVVLWASSNATRQQIAISSNGPSSPKELVFDYVWRTPVDHDDDAPTSCVADNADVVSQCFASIQIPASELSRGASQVLLYVKAKAWVYGGDDSGVMNYGLVYAAFMFPDGATNNHFIHVEAWGGATNYQEERRRVTFSAVVAPIIDGNVMIRIGKQIMGRAELEVAAYVQGYIYE